MMADIKKKIKKTLGIIQARTGSTRFPRKVLKKVEGKTLLEHCLFRVQKVNFLNKIVVATTTNKNDDVIVKICKKIGISYFRGSEKDVLDRYYKCSLQYPEYENIVRITSDCPLLDQAVSDEVIRYFFDNKLDYASNVFKKETFPDGMDTEIFKKSVLYEAAKKAKLSSEREHLTQYIIKRAKFKKGGVRAPYDWSHFRMTIDYPEDFKVIKFLIENSRPDAGYVDYIVLLTKNFDIALKNMHIIRNAGLLKSLEEDKILKKQNETKIHKKQ